MAQNDLPSIALRILISARNELYLNMPYLDTALYALAFAPGEDRTVSAATDGIAFYYRSTYLADCYLRSSSAVSRLYLHSILHCLLRHLSKKHGREGILWDLACDAAVESILDRLPCPCIARKEAPVRQKFYGECLSEMKVLTAEGIYRKLLRDRRPEYELAQLQREFLADDHGLWDMEEKQSSQSADQDEQWKKIASRVQTGMETALSREAEGGESVLEQVRISARDDVDYRAFLRRFAAPREILKSDEDTFDMIWYTYGLTRYGNLPLIEPQETKEDKRIEDLVIAVDTSMSTSGQLVREFLSSTYAILRSTETFTRKLNIHIIQCDDQVRSDVLIRSTSDLKEYMESVSLIGGSATDFRPVFRHIEDLQKGGQLLSLRALLYFTDGMGIYPENRPPYDVAFILLEEPPLSYRMPPWCIRIVLDAPGPDGILPETEDWYEPDELPEL